MAKSYNSQNYEKAIDKRACLHITGDPKKPGAFICFEPRAAIKGVVYCQHHQDLCVRVTGPMKAIDGEKIQ